MNGNTYFNLRFYESSACLAAASGGSKLGSPVTSGVTRRQSRVYFVDFKRILTPILRTWVQKSTLLLQNRGHAEVLKKDPFFREIRNAGATPLCTWVPPPGQNLISSETYVKNCTTIVQATLESHALRWFRHPNRFHVCLRFTTIELALVVTRPHQLFLFQLISQLIWVYSSNNLKS